METTNQAKYPTVVVHYNHLSTVTGLVILVLGLIFLTISLTLTNDHASLLDQKCPALKGSVVTFLRRISVALVTLGTVDLAISGVLPRILVLSTRIGNALCCGHMFMGLLGQVVKFFVCFFALGYNVYGSILLAKANKAKVHSDPKKGEPETFCHALIFNAAVAANAALYLIFLAYLVLALIPCLKRLSTRTQGSQVKEFEHRRITRHPRERPLPWGGMHPKGDIAAPPTLGDDDVDDDQDRPELDLDEYNLYHDGEEDLEDDDEEVSDNDDDDDDDDEDESNEEDQKSDNDDDDDDDDNEESK